MLIIIDESIADNIDKIVNNNELLGCLDYLSTCARNGNHFVLAKTKTADILKNAEKLPTLARKVYKEISDGFYRFGGIKNKVSVLLKVYYDQTLSNDIERIESIECVEYIVPLQYFDSLDKLGKSVLMCEDLKDCIFYRDILKLYMRNCNLEKYKISLDNRNGGGNNCGDNYKYILDNNMLCLAIADSDKKSRSDSSGATSAAIKKEFNSQKNSKITEFYELKVREKENLIPPEIYSTVCEEKGKLRSSLNILKKIFENEELRERYYYGDIKDGLVIDEEKKAVEYVNSKMNEWILSGEIDQSFVNKIGSEFKKAGFDTLFDCNEDDGIISNDNKITIGVKKLTEEFQNLYINNYYDRQIKEKEECLKKIPDNIGIKKNIEDIIKRKDKLDRFTVDLPDDFKLWWNEIGNIIFSWGCSNKLNIY